MNRFEKEARRVAEHFKIYDDRMIDIFAYIYGQGFVDGMSESIRHEKPTRIEDLEVSDATS